MYILDAKYMYIQIQNKLGTISDNRSSAYSLIPLFR